MQNTYNLKNLANAILVSVCILIVGFFLNHNKVAFCVLAVFLFTTDLNEHIFKRKVDGLKKISIIVMLLLLAANLAYSFFLHYHATLDGDLPGIMDVQQAIQDPFGLAVLLHHKVYTCPNRAVMEWCISNYVKEIPILFQRFTNPIEGIYLSFAVAKTLMQAGFIYLFGVSVSGQYKIFNKDFLLSTMIIIPLIQVCGFVWTMGIIDPCLTFAFCYGFSILLVCLYFLPFFMASYHQRSLKFNYLTVALMMLLALLNAFNGSLNGPVILIIGLFILLNQWWKGMKENKQLSLSGRMFAFLKQAPKYSIFLIVFAMFFALYSFYIGRSNSMNMDRTIPLIDRYKVLPGALYGIITTRGPLLLLIMIAVNTMIISRKKQDAQAQKIVRSFLWVMLFSAIYISLLPLGGYRYYRPEVVERDTILPVTIAMIAFYGVSTFYLLKTIAPKYKKIYSGTLMMILLYFVVVNANNKFDNSCQREGIKQIAESKEKIILIDQDCPVMTWSKITDYKDSKLGMDLLRYWGIVHEEKYYYQK